MCMCVWILEEPLSNFVGIKYISCESEVILVESLYASLTQFM